MSFGEQILSRRKELGLTQQNVADELYITRQTLSKQENNKSYPDLKLLLALSEIYHVSVDSLLRENKDLTNRDKASQAFNIIRGLFWLLIGFYFWSPSNYWSNISIPILFCILLEYLSYKECFFLARNVNLSQKESSCSSVTQDMNTSYGVRQPSDLRGRLFRLLISWVTNSSGRLRKFSRFVKPSRRKRPLLFSFSPR